MEQRQLRNFATLCTFLLLPSTWVVEKYTNRPITLLTLLLAIPLLYLTITVVQTHLEIVSPQIAVVMLVVIGIGLLIAFFIMYPSMEGRELGVGSDADDALRAASAELLAGRYPYYAPLYSNNPISPLPGALMFALPFQLIGDATFQTIFWLILFALFLFALMRDVRATVFCFALITLQPIALQQILTGTDKLINALYVMILVVCTITILQSGRSFLAKYLICVLLGVAISSRANFGLVVLPTFAYVSHRLGWRTVLPYLLTTSCVAALVTLPFYFYDPEGFSPLHTAGEIGLLDNLVPYLGSIIVPMLMIVATLIFCHPRFQRDEAALLTNLGWVQALPVLVAVLTITLFRGQIYLRFFSHGTIFFPFAIGPLLCLILDNAKTRASRSSSILLP